MTSVKYFHSDMAGAPTITPTANCFIDVLDACLVNGFGVKAVDSLVVANDVATMTISTGHSAEADTIVLVSGATPSALNGEKRVVSTTTTTITFATSGVSNQTATGTISMKMAPLGWTKPFSATNVAVYRSANMLSPRNYLRVDDSNVRWASTRGYETMTSANDGTGIYPSSTQMSSGLFFRKTSGTITGTHLTATRKWFLIGDDRFFYVGVVINPVSYNGGYVIGCFGDLISYRPGDVYSTINALGNDNNTTTDDSPYYYWGSNVIGDDNNRQYIARTYTGIGGSFGGAFMPQNSFALNTAANLCPNIAQSGSRLFPNAVNQAIYFGRVEYWENQGIRGLVPGWYITPHNIGTTLTAGVTSAPAYGKFDATAATNNRKIIWFTAFNFPAAPVAAPIFFDLTGPWR